MEFEVLDGSVPTLVDGRLFGDATLIVMFDVTPSWWWRQEGPRMAAAIVAMTKHAKVKRVITEHASLLVEVLVTADAVPCTFGMIRDHLREIAERGE